MSQASATIEINELGVIEEFSSEENTERVCAFLSEQQLKFQLDLLIDKLESGEWQIDPEEIQKLFN